MTEQEDYILGTEKAELHRLGLQHQVWAAEARKGWQSARFGRDQTLLDLGCGPGFCTTELAYMVGAKGKIIAVDLSKIFLRFLEQLAKTADLNIELQHCDFMEMKLDANSLDGVYCRWALAWVDQPEQIIEKINPALKPGAVFVAHEYYDWQTFRFDPPMPAVEAGLKGAFKSFGDSPGDINVGQKLPSIFQNQGFTVESIRPISMIATPQDLSWYWPDSFLSIYFPKLVDFGYLSEETAKQALIELEALKSTPGASCMCPQVVEVIARKL